MTPAENSAMPRSTKTAASSVSQTTAGTSDPAPRQAGISGNTSGSISGSTSGNPVAAPSTAEAPPAPSSLAEITTLADIVTLAETNDEMLLAARIRNHVQLVSLKPGNLQVSLVGSAPDQLAGDIARYLSQWTGQRWLVSLAESGGEKTLAEQQRDADEKLRDTIAGEPLVAQILEIFPGAIIDEIKASQAADADILASDDGSLDSEQNADDEEMSR
jgi:DNA polymerase-3 subunit gamma/tau